MPANNRLLSQKENLRDSQYQIEELRSRCLLNAHAPVHACLLLFFVAYLLSGTSAVAQCSYSDKGSCGSVVTAPLAPAPRVELPPPAPTGPMIPPVVSTPPPPAMTTLSTDLTHVSPEFCPGSKGNESALSGLMRVSDKDFPSSDRLVGSAEGIVLRYQEGARFERTSPLSVDLKSGEILLAVSRPSRLALVDTAIGEISLAADSAALVRQEGENLRVLNLDGRGKSVILRLNKGQFSGRCDLVFALAPGYEIVASTTRLSRRDLRPADGLARRNFCVFGEGLAAISEFSLESVLACSGIVATMNQKEAGGRDRRLLGDMSKMAAVLNYMNGSAGFSIEKAPEAGEKLCKVDSMDCKSDSSGQAAARLLAVRSEQN